MATDLSTIRRLILPPPGQPAMTWVYYSIGLAYFSLSLFQIGTEGIGSTVPLWCAGKYCAANFSTTGVIFSGFFCYLVKRGDGRRAIFELFLAGMVLDSILSIESPINAQFYWWSYPLWFSVVSFSLYNMRPFKFVLNRRMLVMVGLLIASFLLFSPIHLPAYSASAVAWEIPQELGWCWMFSKTVKLVG